MEITFLGTSSAVPSKYRNHAGIILKYFKDTMLFDCGEGTQRQLTYAKISPMKIDKIFLSHYHGDHILGLAGLIQSMGFRGRTEDLNIYGPKGLEKLINVVSNYGFFKIDFNINIHEIGEGIVIETDEYIIRSIIAEHNVDNIAYSIYEKKKPRFLREKAIELGVPVGPSFGKLHNGEEVEINGKIIKPEQVLGEPRIGKKITYSGDTRPCEKMVELACDSDVLIHEATYEDKDKDKAIEHCHSTSKEAAEIAKLANVKLLVLTHISSRYTTDLNIKNEAKEIFENTAVADDFMEIKIEKDKAKIRFRKLLSLNEEQA
ncbi:ribonuclease Z [Methanobrevibacter olleyae]|uniref:Ribonuclease Z n=1 Tax=Methanobrevibacter olleyae TaxID=294671 RepID=A0A126QYE8_METOL|nr:ribonuclease Z [Methanobrevibacter olleyae]AMK14834.1 ribonuclease Z Rnz [Methanobrevibacter olleyae]SFL35200.1 ribonuclease Z [Methanobrevibacter olleyae]